MSSCFDKDKYRIILSLFCCFSTLQHRDYLQDDDLSMMLCYQHNIDLTQTQTALEIISTALFVYLFFITLYNLEKNKQLGII